MACATCTSAPPEASWCISFHLTVYTRSSSPSVEDKLILLFCWFYLSVNWSHCNIQFLFIQICCFTYIKDLRSDLEMYLLGISVSAENVCRVPMGQFISRIYNLDIIVFRSKLN